MLQCPKFHLILLLLTALYTPLHSLILPMNVSASVILSALRGAKPPNLFEQIGPSIFPITRCIDFGGSPTDLPYVSDKRYVRYLTRRPWRYKVRGKISASTHEEKAFFRYQRRRNVIQFVLSVDDIDDISTYDIRVGLMETEPRFCRQTGKNRTIRAIINDEEPIMVNPFRETGKCKTAQWIEFPAVAPKDGLMHVDVRRFPFRDGMSGISAMCLTKKSGLYRPAVNCKLPQGCVAYDGYAKVTIALRSMILNPDTCAPFSFGVVQNFLTSTSVLKGLLFWTGSVSASLPSFDTDGNATIRINGFIEKAEHTMVTTEVKGGQTVTYYFAYIDITSRLSVGVARDSFRVEDLPYSDEYCAVGGGMLGAGLVNYNIDEGARSPSNTRHILCVQDFQPLDSTTTISVPCTIPEKRDDFISFKGIAAYPDIGEDRVIHTPEPGDRYWVLQYSFNFRAKDENGQSVGTEERGFFPLSSYLEDFSILTFVGRDVLMSEMEVTYEKLPGRTLFLPILFTKITLD